MGSDSLYRTILGAEFDNLPAVLRDFHSRDGTAEGSFDIERRPGLLRSAAARFLGLPPTCRGVQGRLEVETAEGKEVWKRQIGTWRLLTRQHEKDGLMVEDYGGMQLSFRVLQHGDGMLFEQVGCSLCGVSMPRFLWITVEAVVTAEEGRWRVEVRLAAPALGELCRYKGRLNPV